MDAYVRPIAYRQVLGFVAGLWLRRRGYFFLGLTLTLAATGFDLLLPWASAQLIESVAGSADRATVWQSWALLLVAFAGFAVSRNLAHRLWIPLAARNMQAVLLQGFEHVLSAPADWHANQATGDTVRRLRRAMEGYDAVTDAATIHLGPALVVLLGLILMIGWREPLAGVLALLVALAFVASNLLVGMHWIRPASLQANASDSRLSGIVADVLAASVTIKGFTAEGRERNHMAQVAGAWGASSALAWRRFVDLGLVQNLLLLLLLTGLSGVALYTWTRGDTGAGDVAFAVTSFLLMAGYLRGFGESLRVAQKGLEDASDALLLSALPSEERAGRVVEDMVWRGEVTFEGVSFAYPATASRVLEGLDLHLRPGETLAIAGASGSGKSTIARLLQRFYSPDAGRILLDGQDIAGLPLATLRQRIAVVAQEPMLLNRSIRENIAYSRPGASEEEVMAAAKAACAHDFILQLPQGYDTQVGAYGARLSGGQRQRLALARALLVDAPLLVLDEATSALDPHTESRVLANIAALRPRQTRLVIAHRPAAILAADRVVWMAAGRVE
ncbi:multidrug ABC transporter ATP-binding protein [Stutzerimonas stutzeri]|uniref:Multidrug ABC transporter ATP-binding protein n=1 Tax=Stutzerimonas stutzeri TaxID=316 RepID=A0A2N8SXN3_STUST|nr:ABC transporter ATP-binding protein [Stutzerimonas stutzeri]MCQ4325553.1 ABC transporter ATP-binding protein/permease [Stutzerimonas stutzeri]PNG07249.1 multidrug ABC transporter ATP-binding protein [Stutzerimonas stutzeri]